MAVSRRLTTIEEFALSEAMRPETLAGFKAWLNGKRCATDDEWGQLYARYQNRALGESKL